MSSSVVKNWRDASSSSTAALPSRSQQRVAQRSGQRAQGAGGEQELAPLRVQLVEHVAGEVAAQQPRPAAQVGDRPLPLHRRLPARGEVEQHQARRPAPGTPGQRRRAPRARGARRTRAGTAPRPPRTGTGAPRCPARPAHRTPSAAACSRPAAGGCRARPGRGADASAAGRPAPCSAGNPSSSWTSSSDQQQRSVGQRRRAPQPAATAVSGRAEVLAEGVGRRPGQAPHEVADPTRSSGPAAYQAAGRGLSAAARASRVVLPDPGGAITTTTPGASSATRGASSRGRRSPVGSGRWPFASA